MSNAIKATLGVLGAVVVVLFVVLVWALLLRGPGGSANGAEDATAPTDVASEEATSSPEPTGEPAETATPEQSATPTPTELAPIPEGAIVLAAFALPSRNIQCQLSEGEVRCGVIEASFTPPGTEACTGAARTVVMTESGVHADCDWNGEVVANRGLPALQYGQTATTGPWLCTSSESGLTCESRAGKPGFSVARATFSSY